VIAAGHGIGTLGLLALYGIGEVVRGDSFFQSVIGYAGVANLLGQVLLIAALFLKHKRSVIFLRLLGLFFLVLAFCILLSFLWHERTVAVTAVSGIPFIVLSILLVYKSLKNNPQTEQ
jgi:Ca2+/Na+ antiporter